MRLVCGWTVAQGWVSETKGSRAARSDRDRESLRKRGSERVIDRDRVRQIENVSEGCRKVGMHMQTDRQASWLADVQILAYR